MRFLNATLAALVGCFLGALWLYLNAGFGAAEPVIGAADAPPGVTTLVVIRHSLSLIGHERGSLGSRLVAWQETDTGFALRHFSALPDATTRVLAIVEDRVGLAPTRTQFVKMPTVPYLARLGEKNQLEVKGVDGSGAVYLAYDDKEIRLAPGEGRLLWAPDGGRPSLVWISHRGVRPLSDFRQWEAE